MLCRSSPSLRLHDLMASASLGTLFRSERQVSVDMVWTGEDGDEHRQVGLRGMGYDRGGI